MSRSFFGFAALASVLTLPLIAHADAIDDFVLTGAGHTISYSLPATTIFPNGPSIEFFYVSASATIDGVPGYSLLGGYDAIPSSVGTLQLFVPEAIFGQKNRHCTGKSSSQQESRHRNRKVVIATGKPSF